MALVSSSVDSNAALLPSNNTSNSSKPALPVITPLVGRYIPAAQAAGSQASNDLASSAGGAGLQTAAETDHYTDLPGVGGGLQLFGAALLTQNSSLRFNTAARLGAAAVIEQACWQVGDRMWVTDLVAAVFGVMPPNTAACILNRNGTTAHLAA
jgi:hypothetical protein